MFRFHILCLLFSLVTSLVRAQPQLPDRRTFERSCELLALTSIRQEPGSRFAVTDKHRNRTLTAYPGVAVGGAPATVFESGDSAFAIRMLDHQPVFTRAANRQALDAGKGTDTRIFSAKDSSYCVHTGAAMPDAAFFYELAELLTYRRHLPYDVPHPRPYVTHRLRWYGFSVRGDLSRIYALTPLPGRQGRQANVYQPA